MSRQSNNKVIFGSAAGLLAVVALVWFFTRSGSAVEPSSPTIAQPTLTLTEDEPVARSEPRGSTGRARLEGAAAVVEDEEDDAVAQKSKRKRPNKRQRRKQETEEEEEKDTGPKKGAKKKYFGK